MGFIIGFAWDKTLNKLDSLANEILSQVKSPEQKDEDETNSIK